MLLPDKTPAPVAEESPLEELLTRPVKGPPAPPARPDEVAAPPARPTRRGLLGGLGIAAAALGAGVGLGRTVLGPKDDRVTLDLAALKPYLSEKAWKGLNNQVTSPIYIWNEKVGDPTKIVPYDALQLSDLNFERWKNETLYIRRAVPCRYLAQTFPLPEGDDRLPLSLVKEWASMLNTLAEEGGMSAALAPIKVMRLPSGPGLVDLRQGDRGPPSVIVYSFVFLTAPDMPYSTANLNRRFGTDLFRYEGQNAGPLIEPRSWRWQVQNPDPLITYAAERKDEVAAYRQRLVQRAGDMVTDTVIGFGEPYAIALSPDLADVLGVEAGPAEHNPNGGLDTTYLRWTSSGAVSLVRDDRLHGDQMAMWVRNSSHGYSEELLKGFFEKHMPPSHEDADINALWAAHGDLPGPFPWLLDAWAKEDVRRLLDALKDRKP